MRKSILATGFIAVFIALSHSAPIPFVTGEWEPFTGEKLPNKGIAAEMVEAICKAGGIQYSLGFYPWPRAEKMVEAGEAFAAFPYAISEERKALFDFSDSLFFTEVKVFFNSRQRKFETLKPKALTDLAGKSCVTLSGTWFENDLKKAGIKVEIAQSIESAIKMLQAGRVDIFIEDMAVAYDAIKKTFPGELADFKTLDNSFFGRGTAALMVSKKYPGSDELLAKFKRGYETIKANGTLDAISRKYLIQVK